MSAKTGDPVAPAASTPAPAPVVDDVDDEPAPKAAPAPKAEAPAASGGAQDILAMIRARQGQ
jgi:hypothetical protein